MELKPGKIPENILKRSVLGKISGKRPEVLLGSGVGEDCCVLAHFSDEVFVMSTDPITAAEKNTGDLAVLVTANDLASAGAEPVGILLTVLLPVGTTEEDISSLMGEVTDKCRELSIEIMGGHTEITDVVKKPLLSVTGVGKCPKDRVITTGGAKPGMDLIVTKAIGLEGTSIIASEHRKELLTKLPADLIDRAASFINEISVVEDGLTAAAAGASAMHDVTEGGIYGALWELAEASDVGLDCDLKKIPIRQETVEICGHRSPEREGNRGFLHRADDGRKGSGHPLRRYGPLSDSAGYRRTAQGAGFEMKVQAAVWKKQNCCVLCCKTDIIPAHGVLH